MSLTHEQAVDDINSVFFESVRSLNFKIYWEAVAASTVNEENPWFSFIIRHAESAQRTFGPVGTRMFERTGSAIASIYIPVGKGLSDSYILGKAINDAFEGSTSTRGVWFRRVRMQEMEKDGEYHQTDVIADFEYTEIR